MSSDYQKATTKQIKAALVNRFGWPFSVTKGRGTASHWVDVRWTDGPTEAQVRAVTDGFSDTKNDDSMTDLWVGCQYTSPHRSLSIEGAWLLLGGFDLRKGMPPLWELIQAAGTMACRRNDADGWAAGENWLELKANGKGWALTEYIAAFEALGYCVSGKQDKGEGWTRYDLANPTTEQQTA